SGDITNAGYFYAFTSNSLVSSAQINSINLLNQSGALLTSVLPQSGLPGVNAAAVPLNLSIAAQNNVGNLGTISSSGSLNISASSFTNSGSVVSATNTNLAVGNLLQNLNAAQIQAGQSLYINTGSLVNSGLLSAMGAQLSITGSAAALL